MKQTLQLRLGHHLAMTPQLQQAIRLLQLSTLELHTEVQQALESNPLLELSEEEQDNQQEEKTEAPSETKPNREETDQEQEWPNEASLPDELPVDSAWEDVFETTLPSSSAPAESDDREIEIQDSGAESLHEHLSWQVSLARFSDTDLAIATTLIDSIDEDGYLKTPLEDILNGVNKEYEVEMDEIEAVLHRIQQFDPAGVGSRDLRECLSSQLNQIDAHTPWLEQAKNLVNQHLELLAAHDYNQLMRKMHLSQPELVHIIGLVTALNPRPGSQISPAVAEYVIPDVFVKKVKGRWRVELNPEAIPKLKINHHYASLLTNGHSNNDKTYLKGQMQEARWFIKSLQSRNETLLKVASCIVERQRGFLEHGEEAMGALVLHDVAEAVSMHESTISRVTTRKYMHTPRGIYELKYFFSSHVSTSSGGECSATAIRAFIRKMVADEDPGKPLSDNKIANNLSQQGIEVARRTVAKYREGMSIPPSNERKRLVK